MSAHMTPEQVRSKIDHPIVDGDGHWVEYDPVLSDRMRKVGGDLAADGFLKAMATTRDSLSLTPAERREKRMGQQAFMARQTENTLDRATAMMPRLLYDRLDELGLDFVIVYPTAGLRFPRIQDDATRRAVIRAYNIVSADYFSGLGDRLTPAAIIPMHTPDEAIAELEFVTNELGSKVGMFGSNMARKVPAAAANDPDTARFAVWYDVLGLDSEYDYDPVWAKCVELGIAPTFHSASSSQGLRLSPTNFVYNHIGHFAAAGHATAKAIFLGGVTRRFPQLRFAFLEGGVGWASQLFGDLSSIGSGAAPRRWSACIPTSSTAPS
jgi:predicted TIM-barrel fold metal-dependent hydrolase